MSIVNFVSLNGSVRALSCSRYAYELRSSGILAQLVIKLPLRLQQEWSSIVCAMQPEVPTVTDFCNWLIGKSLAEQFQNPFPVAVSFRSKETTKATEKSKKRNVFLTRQR